MKIPLKSFIITCCIVIFGMAFYQLYWLNSLYISIVQEMDGKIRRAMQVADMNEMQLRLNRMEDGQNQFKNPFAVVGFKSDKEMQISSVSGIAQTNSAGQVETYGDSHNPDIIDNLGILQNELLSMVLLNGIHQSIDNLIPPDLHLYDSLLRGELLAQGIEKESHVELIKTSPDLIMASSFRGELSSRKSDMKSYDYIFRNENEHAYRLWINNPNPLVILQMSGMLMTSFVVILLLVWLFYYFMRTIWRQKTLEEMKDDFINNMTHELKAPLAVSYAAIDSLLVTDKTESKDHRDRYLNIAKDQINHLSDLTEQILSMSRESGQNMQMNPEIIELETMIEAIIRQQSLTAGRQIESHINIEPADLTVVFDRLHLANILNNVIENSIKYSELDVRIAIRAHNTNGNQMEICITDNGLGIDLERQKHIFDKFYRVPTGDRHNVKGFGLGLFYVKETLRRAGGDITVRSKPGKGSIFSIRIPQ